MQRGLWLIGVVLLATCGRAAPDAPAAQPGPAGGRSPVFGAKVVDLAIRFDRNARQSLIAAPETDVPATLTFTDEHGARQTGEVTIHLKGQRGSAQPIDGKPAFKVNLRTLNRFFHLEHLTLNNMVQDRTMLHEALGYQVYEAAGVQVPDTGYVRLTVNGQDYGLYLNLETPDTGFLERRFGDAHGVLYEGAYGVDLRAADLGKFELHEGTDAGRAQLAAFADALATPGDALFYGATARVDTASFLAMTAAGALLCDWDNYNTANNYRIYWDPSTRRWHFIPTGIDQTFGGSIAVFGSTGLLFQRCLASERCTTDYANAVRAVSDRFTRLDLASKMDALIAVIDAAARADARKPYTMTQVQAARNEMRAFIARRPAETLAALSCLDGGHETAIGACGAVVVAANVAANLCLDGGDSRAPKAGPVTVAACLGTVRQRWQVTARGADLQVRAVRGGQVFVLHPSQKGTQIVAANTGKCLAVGTRTPAAAAVTEATCADDPAQKWRVRWTIFQ